IVMYKRSGRHHPNRISILWTVGCAIMSFVGAGFLGFAHTIPQVNIYTHGTLVTAMHGHLAFWGAYAMIVMAIMTYALPEMTGRKLWNSLTGQLAFWLSNIGMTAMTVAFGIAGVAQVYLERKMGLDFLLVQTELQVHFVGLLLAALVFLAGITLFIVEFIRYGLPSSEIHNMSDSEGVDHVSAQALPA
ncbi:MAG: nitric-oxide reductase large subunit, partial [Spirochaetae bacterium HGW-Spirochaetae-9]